MVETRICPDDDNAYIETFRTAYRVGFTDIHGGHEGSVPLAEWKSWPKSFAVQPVYLNHLQAMGLMMLIVEAEEVGKLSVPQVEAKEKIEPVMASLLAQLGMG